MLLAAQTSLRTYFAVEIPRKRELRAFISTRNFPLFAMVLSKKSASESFDGSLGLDFFLAR